MAKCRFFSLGNCTKGSKCPFEHSTDKQICQFYLNGSCKFGSYCSLEHSSNTHSSPKAIAVSSFHGRRKSAKIILPLVESQIEIQPEPKKLCPFALKGNCRFADKCRFVHGLLCPKCNLYCLDPQSSQDERDAHVLSCKPSESPDCVVCLEDVSQMQDSRYGLLDCDHPVCLNCIRKWREVHGQDASRNCPICRVVTHFIVPSPVWPSTSAQKSSIVAAYTEKLSSIDCKYFNFGEGSCPFGTSCLYRHVDHEGKAEVTKLRHLLSAQDQVEVMKQVKISDFLDGI